MIPRLEVLLVIAFVFLVITFYSLFERIGAALAQQTPRCLPRAEMLTYLEEVFDERPVARAVENRGGLIELLESRDGRTWSIIVSGPALSCIASAGEGWTRLKPEPDGPDA